MLKTLTITMGALALLSGPSLAQDASSSSALPSTPQQIAPLPVSDPQDFVNQAAVGNLFEIQTSQLALTQASDATVKQVAQQMVTDHTNADAQLKSAVTAQGNVTVPTALDQPHADMLAKLQAATGTDFDTLYSQMQTQAHIEAVGLFSGYASAGADGALKDFAAATLPTLQHHYEMVLTLPR